MTGVQRHHPHLLGPEARAGAVDRDPQGLGLPDGRADHQLILEAHPPEYILVQVLRVPVLARHELRNDPDARPARGLLILDGGVLVLQAQELAVNRSQLRVAGIRLQVKPAGLGIQLGVDADLAWHEGVAGPDGSIPEGFASRNRVEVLNRVGKSPEDGRGERVCHGLRGQLRVGARPPP